MIDQKIENTNLDGFLRRLLSAPKGKQQSAIETALRLLENGNPPPDQLLLSPSEAARLLCVSKMSIWRMAQNGALKPVKLPGMKFSKYRRADLIKLTEGVQ